MDRNILKKEIKSFLEVEKTFSIFLRPIYFIHILAIYYCYFRQLKSETGCATKNVLIYKNKANFYESFVNFEGFTPCLVKKINSKRKFSSIHKLVDAHLKMINDFLNGRIAHRPFEAAVKIMTAEALIWMIPYILKDLKILLKDKALIKKCEDKRLKVASLFMPGGKMELAFEKLCSVPEKFKSYKINNREFIIFNEKIISDREIIKYFLKIREKKFKKEYFSAQEIKGSVAFRGKVRGIAKIVLSSKDFGKIEKDNILVASTTTPDYLPIIHLASAIVADEGGFLSHAAIVSREFKIPCVIGAKIATKVLKDGDLVEVDADKGIIKILNRKLK